MHGPLGLVHLDSHTDLWESYFGRPYAHGTMFRRALEEGVVDPSRVVQAGMRGPRYHASEEESRTTRRDDDPRGAELVHPGTR